MTAVFGHFILDCLNVRLDILPFTLTSSLYYVAQFSSSFTCNELYM